MNESVNKREVKEKLIVPKSGFVALTVIILAMLAAIAMIIFGVMLLDESSLETSVAMGAVGAVLLIVGIILICVAPLFLIGLKIVEPNEAIVLLLFGKYYGTVSKAGFYWVNIFCTRAKVGFGRAKISLKAATFNNEKQKVNDREGNPIEIGVVVVWRIVNTAKAIFNVDNFLSYISVQSDSAIRHVARQYPYDIGDENDDGDEKSLRGSSQEVADALKAELQSRMDAAGIEIIDTRIAHLAYAPEIAAAMLQRQQANAIIAARQKIVEGAVSMVEMALNKISENKIAEFDAERKAQMVSNLLIILCGNKDAQPIINSGS